MKICIEGKVETLRYKDLKQGDVFTWSEGSGNPAVKTDNGYVYLKAGDHWDKAVPEAEGVITFYPNACITLGDPE